MQEVNLTQKNIRIMKKEEIKNKLRGWNTKQWEVKMEEKLSLRIYRQWKTEFKSEIERYMTTPVLQLYFFL